MESGQSEVKVSPPRLTSEGDSSPLGALCMVSLRSQGVTCVGSVCHRGGSGITMGTGMPLEPLLSTTVGHTLRAVVRGYTAKP